MMRLVLLALIGLAVLAGGCGSTSTDEPAAVESRTSESSSSDDKPPPISRSDYKSLKLGATRSEVFAKFGQSDYAEGPSPATSKVDAERCYTYLIPGSEHEPTDSDYTEYDSWWLCFNGTKPDSKLVHKEQQ